MAIVYKYRMYCTVHSADEFVWSETAPVDDAAHTYTASKTTIVETRNDSIVKIQEEDTDTGGHYQFCGFRDAVTAADAWEDLRDISFPFPITILSAEAHVLAVNDGDEVEFLVGPDTTIGTISADEAASQTVLSVSQSVIDNTFVGAYISLDDGTNVDDLGRVIAVDDGANTITVETATTNSFATITPTNVKQTVKLCPMLPLVSGQELNIGGSKIGGSYIPANTTIRLRYHNIGGGSSKVFGFLIEYLY